MKTKLKLILKGILFYITLIYTTLFICAIDSITTMGFNYLIGSGIITLILFIVCYKTLNQQDITKLSLIKWFDKL